MLVANAEHMQPIIVGMLLTLSNSLINYCNSTRDYMVPSVWGTVCSCPCLTQPQYLANTTTTRSTKEKTHMLRSNQKDAAQSCEKGASYLTLHSARRSKIWLSTAFNRPGPLPSNHLRRILINDTFLPRLYDLLAARHSKSGTNLTARSFLPNLGGPGEPYLDGGQRGSFFVCVCSLFGRFLRALKEKLGDLSTCTRQGRRVVLSRAEEDSCESSVAELASNYCS